MRSSRAMLGFVAAPSGLPLHYRPIGSWSVQGELRRRMPRDPRGRAFARAVAAALLCAPLLLRAIRPRPAPPPEEAREALGVSLASVALTVVAHELVHGLFFRLFGARPRFGIVWQLGAVYATAPGVPFPRDRYLAIGLAPLVLLTPLLAAAARAAPHPLARRVLDTTAVFNALGSVGDALICAVVARYPREALIVDERDGVRVYLPE